MMRPPSAESMSNFSKFISLQTQLKRFDFTADMDILSFKSLLSEFNSKTQIDQLFLSGKIEITNTNLFNECLDKFSLYLSYNTSLRICNLTDLLIPIPSDVGFFDFIIHNKTLRSTSLPENILNHYFDHIYSLVKKYNTNIILLSYFPKLETKLTSLLNLNYECSKYVGNSIEEDVIKRQKLMKEENNDNLLNQPVKDTKRTDLKDTLQMYWILRHKLPKDIVSSFLIDKCWKHTNETGYFYWKPLSKGEMPIDSSSKLVNT